MLENYDIVCFGPSDWWGMNPSCATHIMRRLAAKNRVVYINPVSSDILGMRSGRVSAARMLRKVKSALRFVRKAEDNLYVFSLLFIPLQGAVVADWLNNIFFRIQLHLIMAVLRFDRPILWVENVRCVDFMPKFHWRLIIYHVSDLFSQCPYTYNKDKLCEREKDATMNSDLLICVSRRLFEAKQKNNANTYYLPHGVDFSLFRKAAEDNHQWEKLKDPRCPIAGYFGTLTEQNDIELLEYCAVNLPEICFVFAGQITAGDYGTLMAMDNVIFLGKIPYEDIPKLCAIFEVCLLPWRMTEWIANCNPLKLFEYMASGRPIVSVPINEIASNYSDIVSIAHTKEEFCDAIRSELKNDTQERRRKRIEIARLNRWENHNKRLSDIIQIILEKNDRRDKNENLFGRLRRRPSESIA